MTLSFNYHGSFIISLYLYVTCGCSYLCAPYATHSPFFSFACTYAGFSFKKPPLNAGGSAHR